MGTGIPVFPGAHAIPLLMASARHVAIDPGVAISLAVLGWNLLGDGLRDALDTRLVD
jgi:ABC-type dipeptide/oligopeptide/nickel transport system permease subunit